MTIDEVRAFAITLPRSSEALVRGRVKFRIGRIVYLSFSRDGTVMGFAFPKEWRDAQIDAEPEKFSLPSQSDLRYHWAMSVSPPSTRMRCAISSRMPGHSAFRSGWPRNTAPRGARTKPCRGVAHAQVEAVCRGQHPAVGMNRSRGTATGWSVDERPAPPPEAHPQGRSRDLNHDDDEAGAEPRLPPRAHSR